MEWTDLRYFLAAVRGGNLSAAARELGVNYTTVGRRLDAPQRTVGAPPVPPTPAGQNRELGCTVRLTATETLAARFLIPARAALRNRHPELEIELNPDYRLL